MMLFCISSETHLVEEGVAGNVIQMASHGGDNNKKQKTNHALQDKNFDPSTIEDLMKLFEIESYKAWAAAELEQQKEVEEAEVSMQEAEDYLDSVMESAMDEFRGFEEELESMSKAEMESLV
ncbi:hypothetical protein PIB30_031662 [Stylosanthes scabra]|uniref:Uncharacterized protein n=1 Tax=Stylosanthes scabra TaxID=79078 RepID=A0ABU6YAN6_9FABA|nr:hypothetical protein [Stylosanthes scabra]